MNEFAQGQKSEDLLKLDLANHVYLGKIILIKAVLAVQNILTGKS